MSIGLMRRRSSSINVAARDGAEASRGPRPSTSLVKMSKWPRSGENRG